MSFKPTAAVMLGLAATVAACGSSTPSSNKSVSPVTVTVTAPTPDAGTGSSPATTTSQETTTTTTTAPTTPTRTEPAPAYVTPSGGTPAGGDLQTAVTRLRGLGFAPVSTATFAPDQTLHVLVGGRTGSARSQQAFFFSGPKYLGTDTAAASGMIAVTEHGDTDVTLRYGIYRSGDADCCPSGAPVSVRFELDGGRLMALDPIPSAAARR
jgi:hypothetical protein